MTTYVSVLLTIAISVIAGKLLSQKLLSGTTPPANEPATPVSVPVSSGDPVQDFLDNF